MIGALDTKVQVLSPIETADDYGGVSVGWQVASEIRAAWVFF